MTPIERSAELPNGTIKYFTAGEGRPLLYFHSSAGVRWTQVLEGLARSHALYVPVVPGFDGTPTHAGVNSLEDLAAVAGDFLERVIGERCDVVGHSFGGRLALWLTVKRPELVDHLVVTAPGGFRRGPGGLPNDRDALRRAMFAHPEKLPQCGSSAHDEGNRRSTVAYLGGKSFDEALFQRLPSIRHTSLILQGSFDTIYGKDAMQLLKSALPRSFLVYIWDCAHALEVDQPERVLGLIEGFLRHSEAFVVNRGPEIAASS